MSGRRDGNSGAEANRIKPGGHERARVQAHESKGRQHRVAKVHSRPRSSSLTDKLWVNKYERSSNEGGKDTQNGPPHGPGQPSGRTEYTPSQKDEESKSP